MSYGVGQHMTGENVRILNALQQHFTGSPFQKMCQWFLIKLGIATWTVMMYQLNYTCMALFC